jgi:hypothetical protein
MERTMDMVVDELVDQYANMMRSGVLFDMAYLDYDRKEQEGRNRAMAAKKIGISRIPVLIVQTAVHIRITRFQHYKRAQIGPAWNWNYMVSSPGEYDASTFTLDEAEGIAKRRQKATGYPIVYGWK